MEKLKKYTLICLLMLISVGISSFLSSEIFVQGTYIVRPHLDSYLAMRVQTIIAPASDFIARLQGKSSGNVDNQTVAERNSTLQKAPFSQIATGVAARERDGVAEVRYDLNKVKWIDYPYTMNDGTKVIIKVADGQDPPALGAL